MNIKNYNTRKMQENGGSSGNPATSPFVPEVTI